jgi:ATP-dependent DNA helicase RecG
MNLGKESETLEHKESTSEKNEACDDIAAILNKHRGGILYFGVKNNGDVIGQMVGKDTERTISDSIAANVEPRIFPTIESFKIEKDGTLSKVQFSLDKPAQEDAGTFKGIVKVTFHGDQIPYSSDGRYYNRVSDQDKKVSMVELRKMLALGKYEPIKEARSEIQDLTFSALKRALEKSDVHYPSDEAMKKNLAFYNEDGEYSLYALLVSDQCPFSIKAVRFEGIDKTAIPQVNEFGRQSLIDATNAVLAFEKTLNEVKTISVGAERESTHLFDEVAFREAWLNAVVHTNWLEMTPPAVYFYNDRVEFVSHGGLPYDLTENGFFSMTSDPVNPGLFDLFNKVDLGDETGHGVSKIVAKYGKEAFKITEKFVIVTLPFAFVPSWSFVSEIPSNLSPIQKAVLASVIQDPEISLQKIAESAKLSYGSVVKAMGRLQKLKLVKREGSNKVGKWVAKKPE